jgi:hypothetical protein
MFNFEKLDVWKEAIEFANQVIDGQNIFLRASDLG